MKNTHQKIFVLIACAGIGKRAGGAQAKQYTVLAGKTLLQHTLDAFKQVVGLTKGIVITQVGHPYVLEMHSSKFTILPIGGSHRAQSVFNGLQYLLKTEGSIKDWVMVHDAARCLIQAPQIQAFIDFCLENVNTSKNGGALFGIPVRDALKTEKTGKAIANLARTHTWQAQTPQMFQLGLLYQALSTALDRAETITDESSVMISAGYTPLFLKGTLENFKITYPEDFNIAEQILQNRSQQTVHSENRKTLVQREVPWRIGEGWDIHRLAPGLPLKLSGVEVPFNKGLVGHSDADVVLHAVTDALLGALGQGDIGRHFPDNDMRFKSVDSHLFLKTAVEKVASSGYVIANVDVTIIAQAPKLSAFMGDMYDKLANYLEVTLQQVNIKAKTAEKLGPVGEGQAIECRAVVLLTKA
jgi:2-C-methyl-D-erythritol 4-phosphate cytidylyltransferase/2-C-methyl-D-erythritol 2,4-cyclodiphosphate synthase